MFKSAKAITLIALIITIIVLLILAGVTINMVLGENGLFNKAKTSVAKYENEQEKENKSIAGFENEIDTLSSRTTDYNNVSNEELRNEIQRLQEENSKFKKTDSYSATEDKILENYNAYVGGELITGTMKKLGNISKTISNGEEYTIDSGYTTGGTIKVSSNSEQRKILTNGQISNTSSHLSAYYSNTITPGCYIMYRVNVNGTIYGTYILYYSSEGQTVQLSGHTSIECRMYNNRIQSIYYYGDFLNIYVNMYVIDTSVLN